MVLLLRPCLPVGRNRTHQYSQKTTFDDTELMGMSTGLVCKSTTLAVPASNVTREGVDDARVRVYAIYGHIFLMSTMCMYISEHDVLSDDASVVLLQTSPVDIPMSSVSS